VINKMPPLETDVTPPSTSPEEQLRAENAELRARLQAAEDTSSAAHDSFRHLVEHSPFGIYAVDADFRLALVSSGARKVFENVRPLVGRDFAEVLRIIWAEPFATEAIAVFRHVLESGESYRAPNTQEKRHDISELESYDWKAERITMPDRRLGVVCHFYDLSERQRYEALIREQSQRLRSLVENSPLSVVEWDCNLVITRWTGEAHATFGWSAAEAVGRPLAELDLIYEPDRDIAASAIARLKDGVTRNLTIGLRLCTKDRRVIHCVWHHSVLLDNAGKLLSVLTLGDNVTARKEAEAELFVRTTELRETQTRMRLATETTAVGVWEWDVASNTVRWDAQMFRLYGIAPTADGFVEYADWRGAVLPEDLENSERILQETLRRMGRSRREFRIARRDNGQCRYIEGVETVRVNEAGEAQWVLGTNVDVTERKTAEKKSQQLAAELSEADRRKDGFLATLAHELRNPLAPIRNGLELMKLAGEQTPMVEKARSMMERQLLQMVRLIDDLMDVSRITRDTLELRKELVEVTVILNNAIESSRPLIQQMGHELAVTFPTQSLIVDADMTRLEQVFVNLLNNAAKYVDRGGHIQLTVEGQGSEVVVTVKDTGIGIAADQLPRVFELFTQLDGSLVKSQGGLGIGLTLAKRLVEMHGGTVEAKSEGQGKGSEFSVRLPIATATSKPQGTKGEKDYVAGQTSLRILIVDDNRDSADSLSLMLELMGHDIRTAYDGQEGVDAAGEFRPDMILLDIGLPKLDGYDACRRIREQAWGKGVLVVALTGWGQREDIRRSVEAGFDHHMVKPVDLQALLKLLPHGAEPAL